MLGVSWLWWAVGTLGIGGVIAALVLAPAVALPILQGIVRWLYATRPGWALVAGVAAYMAADIHRTRQFEQEKAEYAQAQVARDQRIAEETRADVWKEIANATAENAKLDADVKEFKDELPPVPHTADNPFRVGADYCRLRRIAGQTGCGPEESSRRVPAPRRRPESSGDHQ